MSSNEKAGEQTLTELVRHAQVMVNLMFVEQVEVVLVARSNGGKALCFTPLPAATCLAMLDELAAQLRAENPELR